MGFGSILGRRRIQRHRQRTLGISGDEALVPQCVQVAPLSHCGRWLFEWQKTDGKKQPYYISMKDSRPFGIAGLWERWDKGEEPVESCAILTTAANELMEPIHERMPVILSPKQFDLWLDPKCQDAKKLTELMQPYQAKDLLAYAISTRVNNPKNDTAACIDPMK